MKKCLVVLLALVLAFAAFSMVVSAVAPSREGGLIAETATGVDSTGKNVQVKIVKSINKNITPFETEFNRLKKENGSLNMLSHVDVTAVGDLELLTFPLTLTIPVSGATASTKGHFLLKKKDGTIVELPATMGDGTATASFPELGEVVFVSDMNVASEIEIGTPDSGTGKTSSDKTSDNLAPFIAVLLISVLALGVSSKKLLAK